MEPHARSGRDTRLLIITIVVSIVMLLVLARFRFPTRPAPAAEPPQPLEQLAARATYDELTSILRGVNEQVSDSVAAVTVVARDESALEATSRPLSTVAIWLRSGRAVALTPPGRGISGTPNGTGVKVVATDARRGVSLLTIPGAPGSPPNVVDPTKTIDAPAYLAAIEATSAGLAIRPMYFGRVDRTNVPGWTDALLRFSALPQALPSGVAIFTLQGEFVGLGEPDGRDLLVVPEPLLERAATSLAASGSQSLANPGFQVQPLDPALRAATGAEDGVIISYVDPDGPSANLLRVGDVVTGIGDTVVHTPDDYRAAALGMTVGTAMTIRFVRDGHAATAQITGAPPRAPAAVGGQRLGLSLHPVSEGSQIARVESDSAAAKAGLEDGDIVTALNGAARPTPTALERAFQRLPSGSWIILAVDRNGTHLVAALGKP